MEIEWSDFYKRYTEQSIDDHAPLTAGVYVLRVMVDENKWKCFYVGETPNLEQALRSHLPGRERNEAIRMVMRGHHCGFQFARVMRGEERKNILKFLFDHYRPPCNEFDPGGKPLEVNLP